VGRILAIDLGEKRIGTAISDPNRIIASPLTLIPFNTPELVMAKIEELVREKEVDLIVVGMPLREDGLEGRLCGFARSVCEYFNGRNIKAVLWDERYSSIMAERVLRECNVGKRKLKSRIDSMAATIILEDFMSSRENKTG
jgi:putative holliday junction resolvase